MEKQLQDLVEQLGTAIDESIAESGRISEIVLEMERAGYDVTLVLEATMRFTPKDEAEVLQESCQELRHETRHESREVRFDSAPSALAPSGKFDLTPEDEEFLQSLKVSV
jgi:hypothetical protein